MQRLVAVVVIVDDPSPSFDALGEVGRGSNSEARPPDRFQLLFDMYRRQCARRRYGAHRQRLVGGPLQPRCEAFALSQGKAVRQHCRLQDVKKSGLKSEISFRLIDALGCERYAERRDTLGGALQKNFGAVLSNQKRNRPLPRIRFRLCLVAGLVPPPSWRTESTSSSYARCH